jgi:hypothetical protein
MCYDIEINIYNSNKWWYWTVFGAISVIGLLNNIHSYFILRTVEKTFSSKFYFLGRSILQIAILYTGITLILDRNLKFQELSDPDTDKLYKRLRFYMCFILAIGIFIAILAFFWYLFFTFIIWISKSL